jgi:DMSO/TMAO reductase YedYZ molybdopterin-dependent catalytic subunit
MESFGRRRTLLALAAMGIALPLRVSADDAILEVKGLVEHPLSLTLADLQKMPQQKLAKMRGVLLRDVLDRAKLVEKKPRDLRRTLIIADARDGYRALFTWVELYLFPRGEGVLVVLERDGAPLPESEGPVSLVSLQDDRTGPRHVKWLRSLEARLIDT